MYNDGHTVISIVAAFSCLRKKKAEKCFVCNYGTWLVRVYVL